MNQFENDPILLHIIIVITASKRRSGEKFDIDDFTISRIEFRLTAEAIGSEEEGEEEESVDCQAKLFCQKHISITLRFFLWKFLKKGSLFPVFNFTG